MTSYGPRSEGSATSSPRRSASTTSRRQDTEPIGRDALQVENSSRSFAKNASGSERSWQRRSRGIGSSEKPVGTSVRKAGGLQKSYDRAKAKVLGGYGTQSQSGRRQKQRPPVVAGSASAWDEILRFASQFTAGIPPEGA